MPIKINNPLHNQPISEQKKNETLFPSGKKLAQNSVLSIFIMILSYIAIYFYNIVLAKLLPPGQFGDIGVTMAIIAICIPILVLGGSLASKLYLGNYFVSQDYPHARGFLVWLRRRFFFGTLLISIIGTLLITTDLTLLRLGIIKEHFFHVAIYAFWLVPLATYAMLQAAIANALQRYVLSIFPTGVLRYFLAIPILYLFAVYVDKMNAFHAIFCIGITYVILICIQAVFLYINLPNKYFNTKVKIEHIEWKKTSLQLFITTIIYLCVSSASLMLLEAIGNTESEVGTMTAMLVILGIMPLSSVAFGYIVNPIVKPALELNQIDYLQKLLNRCNFFNIITLAIVLCIIIFFGSDLLSHFNPDFKQAYIPLLICAFAFAINSCLYFTRMVLMFGGEQKLFNKIVIAQLIIIVVLDLILIPIYQLLGAAIGLATGYIAIAFIALFFVRRRFKNIKTFFII